MPQLQAIDDSHRGKSKAGYAPSAASGFSPARVTVSFGLTWTRRISANKYVRLAAFCVVWTLASMTLVDISFDLAFNKQPHRILQFFAAGH